MAERKNEPKLSKIDMRGKPIKMLPKYTITPQLPKNDPLLQFLKEHTKNDRRE
jgi:hypothetical protein